MKLTFITLFQVSCESQCKLILFHFFLIQNIGKQNLEQKSALLLTYRNTVALTQVIEKLYSFVGPMF
jgi:hypothetical protein